MFWFITAKSIKKWKGVVISRFNEYVASQKPLGLVVEVFYQKPLKECSIREILEALVMNGKVPNQMDTVDYTDDCDY